MVLTRADESAPADQKKKQQQLFWKLNDTERATRWVRVLIK